MASYLPFGGGDKYGGDVETGESMLYPGVGATENSLRWGFVRKVYGIIAAQLVLTAAVAAFIIFNRPVQQALAASLGAQVLLIILSLVGLIPLYIYKDRHPANLVFLALWTSVMAVTVGMACSFYQPYIVLEALALTASIVVGLTLYSFYAVRKGVDFSFMGPFLFGTLWAMIVWGAIQLFFTPGPIARTIYSLLGALLFCAYLVYDTHLLIQRVGLDDYIWASVNIYLDIINLFLYVLRLLGENRNSSS